MSWFHKPSGRLMVATPTMRDELARARLPQHLALVARRRHRACSARAPPDEPDVFEGLARPIFLNVGRVAVEKNIEAFLELDLPGTKVVVGDGPQREELAAKYPEAVFPGAKFGEELAALLRRRRRLRLPVADRHLRPGDPGGHGRGHAGGGLSRRPARSTSSRAPTPGAMPTRTCATACLEALKLRPQGRCAPMPRSSPGAPRPRSSCATCSPIPSPRSRGSGGACAAWPACAAKPQPGM